MNTAAIAHHLAHGHHDGRWVPEVDMLDALHWWHVTRYTSHRTWPAGPGRHRAVDPIDERERNYERAVDTITTHRHHLASSP